MKSSLFFVLLVLVRLMPLILIIFVGIMLMVSCVVIGLILAAVSVLYLAIIARSSLLIPSCAVFVFVGFLLFLSFRKLFSW